MCVWCLASLANIEVSIKRKQLHWSDTPTTSSGQIIDTHDQRPFEHAYCSLYVAIGQGQIVVGMHDALSNR